jgi:zinc transport system permease protein
MSLIGDGIGHAAFAGVAAGYLLDVSPVGAALVAATLAAVSVELLRSRHRAAGDQALALIFYTGIAAGVVLVSAAGALNANLFSFLFGSILTVTWSDFVLVAVLGAVGLAVVAVLYRGFVAVALDEEGARVSGLPIGALNIALAVLAGVTIAVSMRIVGILLIAALMVLPVIAAGRIGTSIRSTIGLAMAIGLVSVVAGLTISYYANLAPGGAIVLLAAGIALVAVGGAPAITRLRSG